MNAVSFKANQDTSDMFEWLPNIGWKKISGKRIPCRSGGACPLAERAHWFRSYAVHYQDMTIYL
jgi:hypothetical protein